MMQPYTDLAELAGVFLEESYVLDIEARPGRVKFDLDFVLTPEHPNYTAPAVGEQFCFRRGSLEFEGVRRLIWSDQGAPPARDATGEIDFGNIDSLTFDEVGFVLEGSWGRMELRAASVSATLLH